MSKRDYLIFSDFTKAQVDALFALANRMRGGKYQEKPLAGKTLAMIFAKSSTRTRVSFEVGTYQLGGHALFLSSRDIQIGRGEPIPDTARVLSRYVDGIMIRTFDHGDVEELAKYATVPVINGLTDLHHPCQILADLLTVQQHLGGYAGKKVAWIGDGNNMANSWLDAAGAPGLRAAARVSRGVRARSRRLRAGPQAHHDADHRGAGRGRRRGRTSSPPTCGPRWARRARRRSGSSPSRATWWTRR